MPRTTRRHQPRVLAPPAFPAPDAALPGIDDLSRMQLAVAYAVALGMSNAAIARHLGRSDKTIKNHVAAMYRTLGLNGAQWSPRARLAYLYGRFERERKERLSRNRAP